MNVAELHRLFEAGVDGLPGVDQKRMFGCDGFFREGTIFGLIWKEGRIGLKLPEPQAFEEAMALPGSIPWTAGNMTMSQWVLVPESFHQDKATLFGWIRRAHTLAATAPKPAKKAAAKKVAAKKTAAKKTPLRKG
jgi:TfoX/Sxy family transcriptional regulator of competence genes